MRLLYFPRLSPGSQKSSNRTVGAYHATERWLQQFVGSGSTPLHIVDVGCGGGGLLRRLELWGRSRGLPLTLTGIDLNPFATQAAREFTEGNSSIRFLTGDAFSISASIAYRPRHKLSIHPSLASDQRGSALSHVDGKGLRKRLVHQRSSYAGAYLITASNCWHGRDSGIASCAMMGHCPFAVAS